MKRWIKLHTEILEDPKMGRMSDRLFRRAIELFLLAGKSEQEDGVLPSVEDMAWVLRLDEMSLRDDLYELEKVGIVHEAEPDVWVVTNFAKRQEADGVAERVATHRKRQNVTKRSNNVTEDVTKRYSDCNDDVTNRYNNVTRIEESREEEKRIEREERENARSLAQNVTENVTQTQTTKQPASGTVLETAVAAARYQELPDEAFAEKIYRDVTGYSAIPPSIRAPAVEILLSLRSRSPTPEGLVEYLRPFYDRWRGQTGRNGKPYSPTGVGWLEWALVGDNGDQKKQPDVAELVKELRGET